MYFSNRTHRGNFLNARLYSGQQPAAAAVTPLRSESAAKNAFVWAATASMGRSEGEQRFGPAGAQRRDRDAGVEFARIIVGAGHRRR
jgi:hypothetical protein